MRLSMEATKQILHDRLSDAGYIAKILDSVVAREEANEDALNVFNAKRERQNEKAQSAIRDAADAKRRWDEAEPEHRTPGLSRRVESLKATAAEETAKLNGMKAPRLYDGISKEQLADAIQQIPYAHRPRAGLKTVEASPEAFEKVCADRLKLRAEWLEVLKAPNTLEAAEKIFDGQLDSLVKKHVKPWFVGSCFRNDVDENSGTVRPRALTLPSSADGKADALTLLLLTAEPLIRAAGKRRLGEAWEQIYEFEGALTPAERTKKAAAVAKKLKEAEELEAAHIRALALAGECPVIRKDIDLKILFGLEPIPEAKAGFEAEQKARAHPNYVASRGNAARTTIVRA